MKVRMTDHSIRIRLGRDEIARLCTGETIDMTCRFPAASLLSFELGTMEECDDLSAVLSGPTVSVGVPYRWIDGWLDDDREGFMSEIELGADERLEIRLEKDFKCLHRDLGGSDQTFPHPDEKKTGQ